MLIKALRGQRAGGLAHGIGDWVADHYGAVAKGMRAGLWSADKLHGVIGTGVMSAMTGGIRRLSRGRLPPWTPAMPRPVQLSTASRRPGDAPVAERVVYFPSCAARNMGARVATTCRSRCPR